MKRPMSQVPVPMLRARRLSVSEAKATLSEVLHSLNQGPTIVHNRGRDIAVLMGIDEYANLVASRSPEVGLMQGFLSDVEKLKREQGGGVDFDPDAMEFQPEDAFRRNRR